MITLDSRKLLFLGSAAAAVTAGAYVLWGPSERKKTRKKKDICPGLVNLGNSCFLNAVLQGLAPNPSVVRWLSNFVNKNRNKTNSSDYLACTIGSVLKILNNNSVEHQHEYCPSDVLEALRLRRWVISSDEQDAHELFHVLTETLEEETTKYPAVVSLLDVTSLDEGATGRYQPQNAACSRTQSRLPLLPGRNMDHPFRGLLASQLRCQQCNHKYPVQYDTFDSISLSIPSNYSGPLTLERLLKHYIMSEAVQDVECDGCMQLEPGSPLAPQSPGARSISSDDGVQHKPRTTCIKKLTIGKLPECLCFHVQRTTWLNNGMPLKRFDHIGFPEVLHMDPYVYHKKTKPTPSPSFDLDLGTGLVGGRKGLNGFHRVNTKKLQQATSPTVSAPYSGPVNLLKALNYHSRATMSGFFVQPPRPATTRLTDEVSAHVQRLARKYSSEARSSGGAPNAYKLTSVVVHLGDVFSGHFVTYRRAPSINGQRFPDRWIYTSDTHVKRASLPEVLRADAYMLFYEKI